MKLTNTMRDTICGAIIAHKFNKPQDDMMKQFSKFGDEVYCDIYDTKKRRLMASLPQGWLPTNNGFYVSFGGLRDLLRMTQKRTFPYESQIAHGKVIKTYAADHAFSVKHMEIRNTLKDIEQERAKYRSQAESILYSVQSVSRLLDVWPEIKAFIPAPEVKAQVPALRIADLNAALNLPPERVA